MSMREQFIMKQDGGYGKMIGRLIITDLIHLIIQLLQ